MLGALVIFLEYFLAIYWWELVKQFRGYRKGEESMSVIQFVVYCVLSFVVLGIILSLIVVGISSLLRHELTDELLFGIVASVLVVFISFQCYRYVKTARKSNIPTSVEDVDLEVD